MSDNIDVVIYKPTKSAMQSGLATNKFWILKYVSYSKTNLDPLMGWSGSDDTSKQIVLKFDLFSKKLNISQANPDVSMSSESLDFIMKNTFGFDTLTVNACFEEMQKGGFSKMTKTMAIENLNNIGISVSISIFLRIDIILLFISRLFAVNKKVNNAT